MSVHRRDLLRAGLGLVACPVLVACAVSDTVSPEAQASDDAVSQRDDVIEVDTARVPQWRTGEAGETAVIFLAAQLIVVRRTPSSFIALSAVCPHAGCGVSAVQAPRLLCPYHGSEFDFAGNRLAGPAPTGLTVLESSFDAVTQRLRVIRRSS